MDNVWEQGYSLPLSFESEFGDMVFDKTNTPALDFVRDYFKDEKFFEDIIKKINGENIELFIGDEKSPLKFDYYFRGQIIAVQYHGMSVTIGRVRGWGHLTGFLSLPERKAVAIQDSFGEFIVKQLNK